MSRLLIVHVARSGNAPYTRGSAMPRASGWRRRPDLSTLIGLWLAPVSPATAEPSDGKTTRLERGVPKECQYKSC